MARWRSVALELLPEFRELIASAETVTFLWIELNGKFVDAYRRKPNEDLIRRVYAYADWCWQAPRHDDPGKDPSTAACVSFLENIPKIPAAREDMPRWFTFDDIVANKALFVYSLGESEYDSLLAYMQKNRHQYEQRASRWT